MISNRSTFAMVLISIKNLQYLNLDLTNLRLLITDVSLTNKLKDLPKTKHFDKIKRD